VIIILLYSTSKPQKCQGLYQKAGGRNSVQLAARISLPPQINYGAKPKVSLKPLQRLAESRDSISGRRSQFLESGEAKRRRSARGESENDSVNRFRRGDALQVRASPCGSPQLVCPRNYSARDNNAVCQRAHGMRPYRGTPRQRSLHYISANCNVRRGRPKGAPTQQFFD